MVQVQLFRSLSTCKAFRRYGNACDFDIQVRFVLSHVLETRQKASWLALYRNEEKDIERNFRLSKRHLHQSVFFFDNNRDPKKLLKIRWDCKPRPFQVRAQEWDGAYNCMALHVRSGQLLVTSAYRATPVASRTVDPIFLLFSKVHNHFVRHQRWFLVYISPYFSMTPELIGSLKSFSSTNLLYPHLQLEGRVDSVSLFSTFHSVSQLYGCSSVQTIYERYRALT